MEVILMKRKLTDFLFRLEDFRCYLAELISCTLGARITIALQDLIDYFDSRKE